MVTFLALANGDYGGIGSGSSFKRFLLGFSSRPPFMIMFEIICMFCCNLIVYLAEFLLKLALGF